MHARPEKYLFLLLAYFKAGIFHLQEKCRCRNFPLNFFSIVSGQVELIYSDGLPSWCEGI